MKRLWWWTRFILGERQNPYVFLYQDTPTTGASQRVVFFLFIGAEGGAVFSTSLISAWFVFSWSFGLWLCCQLPSPRKMCYIIFECRSSRMIWGKVWKCKNQHAGCIFKAWLIFSIKFNIFFRINVYCIA